jgi:hypothetical protein
MCVVRFFGLEFDVVLVRFVLLALFVSLSVSEIFWFCIIKLHNYQYENSHLKKLRSSLHALAPGD